MVMRVLGIASIAFIMLGLVASIGAVKFGSIHNAVHYLAGQRIVPSIRVLELGNCNAGQTYKGVIALCNLGDADAQLIHSRTSCSCIKVHDKSITIPPGQSRPITLSAHFSQRGPILHSVKLFFKTKNMEIINVAVAASVLSQAVDDETL